MEEYVYYASLYDCYKDLLTKTERECFDAYYCEDYSMQEIADSKSVSRSAVHKNIKTVVEKLNYYEDILHLNEINKDLKEVLNLDNIDLIKEKISEILNK